MTLHIYRSTETAILPVMDNEGGFLLFADE